MYQRLASLTVYLGADTQNVRGDIATIFDIKQNPGMLEKIFKGDTVPVRNLSSAKLTERLDRT